MRPVGNHSHHWQRSYRLLPLRGWLVPEAYRNEAAVSYTSPDPKPTPRQPKGRQYMKRKTPRRIKRETAAEKYWKAWVHTRPCVGNSFKGVFPHVCVNPSGRQGVTQMHFRDMTGLGLKEDNFQSLPGCENIHWQYDYTAGEFAPGGKVGKKAWFQARLIEVRADFIQEHGCKPEEWAGAGGSR